MFRLIRIPLLVNILTLTVMGCTRHIEEAPLTPQSGQVNYQKAAELNIALGLAYLQQGDVERAKEKLLRAVRLAPKKAEAYEALGVYYEKVRLFPRAEEAYWQALALAPESGGANYHFGAYLCREQDYAKAESYFKVALEDVQYSRFAEVLEMAGLCAHKAGNQPLAEAYFLRAQREGPSRGTSWFYGAQYAFEQGQYQAAYEYLLNYNRLPHQDDAESLKLQFEIAEKNGDGQLAEDAYIQLQTQFPHSSQARALVRVQREKEDIDG